MIANIVEKVKLHHRTFWQGCCLVLVGWAAYNLGQIYAPGSPLEASGGDIQQETAQSLKKAPAKPSVDKSDLRVVASKGSKSKKYHHTWCSSGKRIKEANQLWFASAAAAQAAGYTLAGNCTE